MSATNQSCTGEESDRGVMERGLVLVVDDEAPVGELLTSLLKRRGFEVEVVQDPKQAASRARALRPALITLDVSMPGVDGLELLGVLRHDPETSGTPVVVISGTDAARAARLGGAAAFVPKPVDPALLYGRIDRALAEAQTRAQRLTLLLGGRTSFRRRARRIFGSAGFLLVEAGDRDAVLEAAEEGPVAAVLDADLPPDGALDAVQALRALPVVGDLPVVLAGGRLDPEARASALETGCDDVLPAPVYPAELLARIQRLVRRRIDAVDANPSTGLPGGVAIEREIARRVGAGQPFVFCYADVDHFKAFNDVYGYAKADGVIRHLASLLVAAGRRHGAFVGHVGGDDFVILAAGHGFDDLAQAVTSDFDRLMGLHYDPEDLEKGFLEAADRYGTVRRFPLLSLSLAALTVARPERASLFALSAAAADAKRKVKHLAGSNVLVRPAPGEGPSDPAADLGRVRAEIERNPALVREVRRLAAARRPAGAVFTGTSLDEALLVLGYKEVRRLVSERGGRTP